MKAAGILAFVLLLASPGCILLRLFEMERQLCDFDGNFQFEVGDGIRVLLREPVLLDDDVTWIVGAPPTEQRLQGNHLIMTYLAEKQAPLTDPRHSIPVELVFVHMEGHYRLKEAFIGRNMSEVLTSELILQCMKLVCRSEKSILERKVTVDFSEMDPKVFPYKDQVLDLIGKPHYMSGNSLEMTYNYVLKTDSAERRDARIHLLFDGAGRIQGLDFRYSRYRLTADMRSGKAYLSVTVL